MSNESCVEWSTKPNHSTQWCLMKTVGTWQGESCGRIRTGVVATTNIHTDDSSKSHSHCVTHIWRAKMLLTSCHVGPWLTAWPLCGSSSGSSSYMVSDVGCPSSLKWQLIIINYHSYYQQAVRSLPSPVTLGQPPYDSPNLILNCSVWSAWARRCNPVSPACRVR